MTDDLRARLQMNETQISRLDEIVSKLAETTHQAVAAVTGIKEILQDQKDSHKEFRDSIVRLTENIELLKIKQESHSNSITTLMESRGWMLGGISLVLVSVVGAVLALVIK